MDNFCHAQANPQQVIYVTFSSCTTDVPVQRIVVASYAQVTVREIREVVEAQSRSDMESKVFLKALVEITLGAHAQVTYELMSLQLDQRNHDQSIARDITFILEGERAHVVCKGAGKITGSADQTLKIRQLHKAAHTTSVSSIKMVLDDHARMEYQGHVYIDPKAHQSNATQDYKALVLANTVQVSAQPELEILHNNVVCKHGVAIGQLNKEHIFYGMSRGINEVELKKILIEAFLKA